MITDAFKNKIFPLSTEDFSEDEKMKMMMNSTLQEK